jgi:hypothetical protein
MTTTNEPTRTGRPSPSPASSSTVAIVLAVIAALVGFFIIKQVRDDGDSGGAKPSTTTVGPGTTLGEGSLPPVSGAPTTAPGGGGITTGSNVQVVNASAQNGVAGQLTTALAAQKFTMAAAGNSAGKSDTSHVYYDPATPAAKPVADTVASMMGIAASEAMPTPIPTKDGTLPGGCGVLVVLGADKAGKPLAEMGGTATTVPTAGATSTSTG